MYSYPLYPCMVSVGVDNPKVINIDINILSTVFHGLSTGMLDNIYYYGRVGYTGA